MDFRQKLISVLHQETGLPLEELNILVGVPPDPKMGDYAFPCFKLGKNPKEEAEKLKQKIKLPSFIASVQVIGPYLNFFVNTTAAAQEILSTIQKEKRKYGAATKKKNVVIEYCGPNTNKPLHLGHLRNMALGNALCHILAFYGNTVHPVNIVNDRGVHICKSMLAYQRWGKNQRPTKKGDHFVGDFYVLYAQHAKDNETLETEVQEMLQKWEKNEREVRILWKKMNAWVLQGFKETYARFGVSFEKEYFESQYYEKGKNVALEGLHKGVFIKDEKGSITAPLEQYHLPNKVVLRADGTSIYITQDMYLAALRYDDYKYDQLIYVVASEQNLHFQQLFRILELLKYPFAKKLYHLSYGLVNLPSGRMKSREGTVVDADDIMDEVATLALKEVEERYKDLSPNEKKYRAEFIALGALKFFLLRTDAVRDIIYNPEESLSFEGETGPYLQYTHARACSILRKAPATKGKVDFTLLHHPQELTIIKLLGEFPGKVKETAEQYKIHSICRYLLDLAQAFNEFYHALPVISEEKEVMKARLLVVKSVRQVLANGLELLGIEAPNEM